MTFIYGRLSSDGSSVYSRKITRIEPVLMEFLWLALLSIAHRDFSLASPYASHLVYNLFTSELGR